MGEAIAVDTTRVGRRIIERPRLTRLLSESESRVMLLVAPAGYGKTTLARQWLRDRKHAWYQATPASSDVAALALGLAEAGASVVPGVDERTRGRLKTVGDAAAENLSLAADLAADFEAWPTNARLVIDDYHLLAESDAADAFVEAFVRATQIPVLITSRTRPSWVTARNLLYGEVVEFGRNVLAMSHEEAAAALAHSHAEMPGLVSLAEGWPAVIGLAALVPHPLQESGSEVPETLHEYFAEELYHALSEDAQWQVSALSIATHIDESVAKALFGRAGINVVDRACAFGFLTRGPGMFEMHPLLRQFLHLKLNDFDDAEVRVAATNIANAYADAERWDDAAEVAIDFKLADPLLQTMSAALDGILSEGRLATLERWLAAARSMAPASSVVRMADIELAFRTGDWVTAGAKANQLAQTIANEDQFASRVYLRAGQMAHLDDRQQDALELLTAAKVEARSTQDLRSALWSAFLTLCDLEKRDEAQSALHEVEELPLRTSDDLLRANHGRLQFAIRWGPLVETLDSVAGCLDLVEQSSDPLVRTGFLQSYGSALGLVARYDDARRIAAWQLQEADRYRLNWVVPHALQMRAIAQSGKREFRSALKTLSQARRLAREQGNIHTQVNGLALTARVHLSSGAAQRAATLLDERSIGFSSPGMEGEYLATQALAAACCAESDKARALIERSESVSSHLDAAALRDFARVIAARHDTGRVDRALTAGAVSTTQLSGNYDAFVCAYRAFPPLLEGLPAIDAPELRPLTDIICALDPRLATKIGLHPARRSAQPAATLTPREAEIFAFIKQGRSNREIAHALWITESTVKVHVRHILEKLDVRSRTEAAALEIET